LPHGGVEIAAYDRTARQTRRLTLTWTGY